MSSSEASQVTGTLDKDYNIIWFTEQCLRNVLRLQTYIEDANRAGDSEAYSRGAPEVERDNG